MRIRERIGWSFFRGDMRRMRSNGRSIRRRLRKNNSWILRLRRVISFIVFIMGR